MNSDKCWTHRAVQGTSAFFWGDDFLRDLQFGCTGGSRADASGSHRAGRKEKPHHDNGKKPKCAQFYRNDSWRLERKAIKGCTARIVPNHSAFRKRNDSLVTLSSSRNAASFSSAKHEMLPVVSRNSGYRHISRRAEKHGIAVLPEWLPWSRSRIPWIPRN